MDSFKVIVLLAITFFTQSHALKCYTCTSSTEDIDEVCINDPASVTAATAITDCNKKYCTIVRQEYVDPKGKVASMSRGCVDEPTYLNNVIEDASYRIYYTSCTEDLCNSGSGTDLTSSLSTVDQGPSFTLYVRGTGSASTMIGSLALLLVTQFYLRF